MDDLDLAAMPKEWKCQVLQHLALEVMGLLLEMGFKANTREGAKALWWASKDAKKDMVKLLVREGADVNARLYGQPILHVAVESGSYEVLQLLLGSGARINDRDDDGQTAMGVAEQEGNQEIIRLPRKKIEI